MRVLRACTLLFALIESVALANVAVAEVPASSPAPEDTHKLAEERRAAESKLESIAIIDREVMIPMRDGTRIAADIYRPKDMSKKYPIVFVRTPYNFNYWDVQLGAPSDMREQL